MTTSRPSGPRRTSRRMPRSRSEMTGISGSASSASAFQAASTVVVMASPHPVRMGPGQALHLGEQEAEMLGVDAELAFRDIATGRRALQRGFGEGGIDDAIPVGLQHCQVDADAGGDGCRFGRAAGPEFFGVG